MTAPSPGGVQRWDMDYRPRAHGNRIDIVANESDTGDWVRYGDVAGMAGENERLRKALEGIAKYGRHLRHLGSCVRWRELGNKCDCGLAEATEALRGAAGEVPQ